MWVGEATAIERFSNVTNSNEKISFCITQTELLTLIGFAERKKAVSMFIHLLNTY